MFRRKKKEKKVNVEIKHIPLPILIRQAIYDTMLEPAEGIAEAMGLPPISEDVKDMEYQASQARLERFAQLLPFIDSHSDIASRITAAAYMLEDDNDSLGVLDIDEDDLERLTSLFKIVALSSSISCISSLFNLELLESKAETHNGF